MGSNDSTNAAAAKVRAAMAPVDATPLEDAPAPVVPDVPDVDPVVEDAPRQTLSTKEKGLLAALKQEREKRQSLADEVEALKQRTFAVPPAARPDHLAGVPDETRDFWQKHADPLIGDRIQAAIEETFGQYRPAIEEAARIRESRVQEAALVADLNEFVMEQNLDGVDVDPVNLLETIKHYEDTFEISLGKTNRKKFENALNMQKKPTGDVPKGTKTKDKEAAKTAAAGVTPGATSTAPPPNHKEELRAAARAAGMSKDIPSLAAMIAKRLAPRPAGF